MDYIRDRFETSQSELGLEFIGYGDEQTITRYPAVVIEGAPVDRDIHATRQFQTFFQVILWIYHGRLSASHAIRTKEDLELTTRIVANLHTDRTLGGNIIFGFVSSEAPTPIPGGGEIIIVGTRIIWSGRVVHNFPN